MCMFIIMYNVCVLLLMCFCVPEWVIVGGSPHSSMSALEGAVEFPHTQGCLYMCVYDICMLRFYVFEFPHTQGCLYMCVYAVCVYPSELLLESSTLVYMYPSKQLMEHSGLCEQVHILF